MRKDGKFKTDFLFSTSSFWGGIGSVLSIAGNYFEFNTSISGEEADRRAIETDWGVVGEDVGVSMGLVERKLLGVAKRYAS
jgi:hypothetical protein